MTPTACTGHCNQGRSCDCAPHQRTAAPANRPFVVRVSRLGDWLKHAEFLTWPEARECARCFRHDFPGVAVQVIEHTGGPLGPVRLVPAVPPLNYTPGIYARLSRAGRERFNSKGTL